VCTMSAQRDGDFGPPCHQCDREIIRLLAARKSPDHVCLRVPLQYRCPCGFHNEAPVEIYYTTVEFETLANTLQHSTRTVTSLSGMHSALHQRMQMLWAPKRGASTAALLDNYNVRDRVLSVHEQLIYPFLFRHTPWAFISWNGRKPVDLSWYTWFSNKLERYADELCCATRYKEVPTLHFPPALQWDQLRVHDDPGLRSSPPVSGPPGGPRPPDNQGGDGGRVLQSSPQNAGGVGSRTQPLAVLGGELQRAGVGRDGGSQRRDGNDGGPHGVDGAAQPDGGGENIEGMAFTLMPPLVSFDDGEENCPDPGVDGPQRYVHPTPTVGEAKHGRCGLILAEGATRWDNLAVWIAMRKREEKILARFKEDAVAALNVMNINMTPEVAYRIALAQGFLPHSADDGVWKSMVEGSKIQLWGYTGVLGKTADVAKPAQVVGVQIGPMSVDPNVFANDKHNLETAVEERITKKAIPRNIPNFVKAGCGNFVNSMMHKTGIFSTAKVQEWLFDVFDIKDLMSGKWSAERKAAVEKQANEKLEHVYKLECKVKLEQYEPGKPPRLIVIDGDIGQLYALLCIKCLEALLFAPDALEIHSIKHKPTRVAIADLLHLMRRDNERDEKTKARLDGEFIEGDGSAWDTTCSVEIRNLIENPLLAHILTIVAQTVWPLEWGVAHDTINTEKLLKLKFKQKGSDVETDLKTWFFFEIAAIRRSGHAGTSVLNFLVNFVMWHVLVFGDNGHLFLDPRRRRAKDRWGTMRWMFGGFEGDDSGIQTFPAFEKQQFARMTEDWKFCGFNMKLKHGENIGMFIGHAIEVDNFGPTGVYCPDMRKFVKASGLSVSPAIIEAFKQGNEGKLNSMTACTYIARAYQVAAVCPILSAACFNYAESLTDRIDDFWDRESIMFTGCPTRSEAVIQLKAEWVLHSVDFADTLARCGYDATVSEIESYSALFDGLHPSGLPSVLRVREVVPMTWKS